MDLSTPASRERFRWPISRSIDIASPAATVYPLALQQLNPLVRWAPHLFFLRPKMRAYLDSVVRGFEWSITRGRDGPRNQFGSHRWFS